MKKLNTLKTKLTAKAMTTAFRAKKTLENNSGMEVLQVLIIVAMSFVLGALLIASMETSFTAQLATVGNKMTAMFK